MEIKKLIAIRRLMLAKPYIAVGMKYYIELRMTEMSMCKSIMFTNYCEELFVVRHNSATGCASTIFYDLGPNMVNESCTFKYMFDTMVPPTILDAGKIYFWLILWT